MRRLLLAACVAGWAAGTTAAPRPGVPDPVRVEEAIAAAVRARMGADAEVVLSQLEVIGERDVAFLEAVPEPDARAGERVRFRLIGSDGAGLGARTVGSASAVLSVQVEHVRARTLVARGRELGDADVESSQDVVERVPLKRLPRLAEVAGARALVNLAPGEVVTRTAVTARPAVRSGQVVRATARVGSLEVTASLVAVQDGAPGAVIRVVNKDSRRELRARVLAPGVVEVMP